jgi:hypothetical protein
MATLTKANNSTFLNFDSSWSPAQVPTASDTLVFDQTLGVNTTLGIGLGTLHGYSLLLQNPTAGAALTVGNQLNLPVSVESVDMVDSTNTDFSVKTGISSPTSTLRLSLNSARTLFIAPSESDVVASFALKAAGRPTLTLNAAPSDAGSVNYQMPTNQVVTVGATEDAYGAITGYMGNATTVVNKMVITGHPTLPTAVKIKAPIPNTQTILAGSGLRLTGTAVYAVEVGNDGMIYWGGSFTSIGTTSPVSLNNLFAYDPVSQRVKTIGLGASSSVYALKKDTSGNIYIGLSGFLYGDQGTTAIGRYNPSTGMYSSLANGMNNGYARAIHPASSGLVYVGGTFTQFFDLSAVNRIAAWDPTANTWAKLGAGTDGVDGEVFAIAEDGLGRIWVAGSFINAGGNAASKIAVWDPTTSSWSSPTGVAVNSNARALAYDAVNNRMYVGYIGSSFAGLASNGTVYYDFNTSTWVAISCPSSFVYGLRWDAASGRLYAANDTASILYWRASDSTWNVLATTTSIDRYALALDASGNIWYGMLGNQVSTPVSTIGMLRVTPAGAVSAMDYAPHALDDTLFSSTDPLVRGYAGTNFGTTPLFSHSGGTATYTIAPGSDLCLQTTNGTGGNVTGVTVEVRRGGALLELPTYEAQKGLLTIEPNDPSLYLSGDDAALSLEAGADANFDVISDTNRLEMNRKNIAFSRYTLLNFKGSELVIGSQASGGPFIAGTLGDAALTVSRNAGWNYYETNANLGWTNVVESGPWAPRKLYGAPREMGPVNLAATLNITTSYFRASDTIVSGPVFPAVGVEVNFGSSNCISLVDWTSPSDTVLQGSFAIVRMNSLSSLSYLGTAALSYSSAAPLTVTQPKFDAFAQLIMEEGSGALSYAPRTIHNRSGGTHYLYLYNAADNQVTGEMESYAGPGLGLETVHAGGTGTLRVAQPTQASLLTLGGNIIIDFSAATAPAQDMLNRMASVRVENQAGGSVTFIGKPGQDTSQYLTGGFAVSTSTTTAVGDLRYEIQENGATSFLLDVLRIATALGTAPASPMYIKGVSATANIRFRTTLSGTNGMLNYAILVGTAGQANWIANITANTNTGFTGYTGALPTSGGSGTANYFLNGGQVQAGNVSAYALKITPTASGEVFDHTGFTVSGLRQFMLCGNAGGVYTIQGSQSSAFAFSPRLIANVSNTELQLVTQLDGANSVATSGTGVISFGSPTTTYRSLDTAERWLLAAETRIYAGTDNVVPLITTNNSGQNRLQIGSNAALRLLGSGTGRALNQFLTLQANARLIVDEDWTIAGFYSTTGIPLFLGKAFIEVAATKTLSVERWTLGPYSSVTSHTLIYTKKGAGTLRYLSVPLAMAGVPYLRIEEGSIEFAINANYGPWGKPVGSALLELLAGRSCLLNSTVDHEFPFVVIGAGSVTKSNTNKVSVRALNSFTGGLSITAGEYDAQFRQACGDGNVTVSGGVLRASAVEEDPYALEIAGNLVFSGGSLALGAAYVV